MINSSNTEGRKYNPKLVMKFKDWINYKINPDELIIAASHVPFVTPTGKIEAARRTGASRKQQTLVVKAIKRARYLALLPFTIDDAR